MIQFPETAATEWQVAADAVEAERRLRERIRRDTEVEREAERLRVRHKAAQLFQQELDAEDTPELEMVSLSDFQSNPSAAPTDLIEGVLKAEGLCLMLGPSGSGKSTLGLQMLHSLLTGDDWLGQTTKPIMGSVGAISYDMDAAMMLDWMAGFPNVDSRKVSVVNAYKRGNPLGVPHMRERIASAWRARNVEVVLLDSFSASFFGHDQNDAATTMAYYRDALKFALNEVGAKALIVIVHSTVSSPEKVRGSTVHHDVADSIVGVVADITTGERTVKMLKYRAARGQVQMDPVIVTKPDDVTHLVDLDLGAMNLKGYHLPASAVGAAAFTDVPDTHEQPDTDSDEDEDEEEL